MLPETHHNAGAVFAERLRTSIAGTAFSVAAMRLLISVSIEPASWDGQASAPTAEALIRLADRVLYRCKRAGALASPHEPAAHRTEPLQREAEAATEAGAQVCKQACIRSVIGEECQQLGEWHGAMK